MSSSFAPVSVTFATLALLGGALTMANGHGAAQGDGPLPLSTAVVALVAEEGGAGEKEEEAFEADAVIETTALEAQRLGITTEGGDAEAEPSRTDLVRHSEAERRILSRLRSRTPPMDFIEQPLRDVMQIIKDEIGGEIWFDEVAMEEAAISPDALVTCQLQGLPLKSALRLLLRQLGLTYVVKDDVLVVTTEERASQMMEPHVYKLDAIVGSPVGLAELAEVLPETVRPETWSVSGQGEGTIKTLGQNLLVINQTPEVHEELESFFDQLYEGEVHIDGSAKPEPSSPK